MLESAPLSYPGTNTNPVLQAQVQTDALIQSVNQQMAAHTFDSSDRQILQRLVESFADDRGKVRLRIAETLGEIGQPAAPQLVDGLIRHDNPRVRRACAKTLTLIADPDTIPPLLHALLNDEDTVVKGSCMGALARMGEAAVPPLLDILTLPESPESTKGHAAWALAFIGAEAKEQLYAAIASEQAEVRSAVVGAVSNIAEEQPEERAFQILMDALADPAAAVRSEAASALGKLAYHPALPQLIELLQHDEGESRKAAALALMKLGDRLGMEPLQAALERETDYAIARVVQLAISQLQRRLDEGGWE
jgi:bilin biosynthesis protein